MNDWIIWINRGYVMRNVDKDTVCVIKDTDHLEIYKLDRKVWLERRIRYVAKAIHETEEMFEKTSNYLAYLDYLSKELQQLIKMRRDDEI